jgi:mRNA interferase MazF
MVRGVVVTVAAAGDYDRPRPAVIVQADAFPASHAADKPVTIRRERIGRRIGHLDDQDITRLNLADWQLSVSEPAKDE